MKYIIIFSLIFMTSNIFSFDRYGIIKESNVNYRTKPSLSGRVIGKTKYCEYIEILEKSKNKFKLKDDSFFWYKIKKKNKSIGWLYGKFITFLEKKPEKVFVYINYLSKKLKIKKFKKCKKYNEKSYSMRDDNCDYKYFWKNEYSDQNFYMIHIDLENGIIKNDVGEQMQHTLDGNHEIYKFDGKKLKKIFNLGIFSDIFFYKKYIIVCNTYPSHKINEYNWIKIFDTKKFNKEKGWQNSYPGSYYKEIKIIETTPEIKSFSFNAINFTITINKKNSTKGKIDLKKLLK